MLLQVSNIMVNEMSIFESISDEQYLDRVIGRLKSHGYRISGDIKYENQVFKYTARKTIFEAERFGLFTTFFIMTKMGKPDFDLLKEFSSVAFKYARKTRGIFPPPGLFYGMLCFPVVVVDSIDNATIDFIHRTEPPKHWACSEKLAVFSLETKWLHYCTFDFGWGELYYQRDREIIKNMLSL
jgi:hypothetical protein